MRLPPGRSRRCRAGSSSAYSWRALSLNRRLIALGPVQQVLTPDVLTRSYGAQYSLNSTTDFTLGVVVAPHKISRLVPANRLIVGHYLVGAERAVQAIRVVA